MDYFGAIDQGTTSTRFIVYDEEHKLVTQHQIEIKQYLNQPGYVEHNPEEIWKSVVDCVNGVSKDFDISLLSSIGITNQRETTLAWRKSTGEHLHNAIVWQDTRTQDGENLQVNIYIMQLSGKTLELKIYVMKFRLLMN